MTRRALLFLAIVSALGLAGRARAQIANTDLAIAASASSPTYAGVPITMTVVVSNLGPDSVTGVATNHDLPESAAVLATSVVHSDGRQFPGGCFVGTGRTHCNLGSIVPQANATVTIVFIAREGSHVLRSWTLAALHNDPNTANNVVELSLLVSSGAVPVASPFVLMIFAVVLALIAWMKLE